MSLDPESDQEQNPILPVISNIFFDLQLTYGELKGFHQDQIWHQQLSLATISHIVMPEGQFIGEHNLTQTIHELELGRLDTIGSMEVLYEGKYREELIHIANNLTSAMEEVQYSPGDFEPEELYNILFTNIDFLYNFYLAGRDNTQWREVFRKATTLDLANHTSDTPGLIDVFDEIYELRNNISSQAQKN